MFTLILILSVGIETMHIPITQYSFDSRESCEEFTQTGTFLKVVDETLGWIAVDPEQARWAAECNKDET
jgi:hypothetical protein